MGVLPMVWRMAGTDGDPAPTVAADAAAYPDDRARPARHRDAAALRAPHRPSLRDARPIRRNVRPGHHRLGRRHGGLARALPDGVGEDACGGRPMRWT